MIDFHAHVLPAADHGSDSLKTSLAQLKLAEQAGIDTLIATPHFYPQTEELDDFLKRRDAAWTQLREAYHGSVQLRLGAEIHMCPGLDHMDGLEQLCVDGTKVLLLELGFRAWTKDVTDTVLRIREGNSFVPVLAHVDRYQSEQIETFFYSGISAQLNADAFVRLFGKRRFLDWIDSGDIVALGSDIHGTAVGYKFYTKARNYLKDRFDVIMTRTENLINKG